MPAAAASRSALAATIVGFLPPISVIAGPRVRALLEAPAERAPDLGGAGEDDAVDRALGERAAGRGAAVDDGDRRPRAARPRRTPRRRATPVSGVCSDGLMTTVFPATSAPADMPVTSAAGKLNGPITPKTPNGRSTLRFVSSGVSCPSGISKPSCASICAQ